MSFFDEADEPPRTESRSAVRSTSRRAPRRRPPSGNGRPPQQAVQFRRAVAIGVVVIIALVVALAVHSCDVSSTHNALQDYTNRASSLISQSNQTGSQLFAEVTGASKAASPTAVRNQIDQIYGRATSILHQARTMSVPSQVSAGNDDLVRALQMRADGIAQIAKEIEPALGGSSGQSAVQGIAEQMARFYASDVVYKDYAAPRIAAGVNGAGVHFSGLDAGQFVPDVHWVLPSFVADRLHVPAAGQRQSQGHVAPGIHGHALSSVTVGGTALSTGATNTLPTTPAPSFTLNFANTGTDNETNVVCRVSVSGTSVSGTSVVPQTKAGQPATCQVTLGSTPPTGTYTVVATIERVPGETSTVRNTQSFPVTFH